LVKFSGPTGIEAHWW